MGCCLSFAFFAVIRNLLATYTLHFDLPWTNEIANCYKGSKMKKICFAILILSPFTLMQGCASIHTEKKLESKLSLRTEVKTWAELRSRILHLIEAAKGLSEEQKTKLLSLHDMNRTLTEKLSAESIQLRSILVEDLISPQDEYDEVALIKKRIKVLEERRLSLFFDTIEQARLIMGRDTARNRKVMQDFMHESHYLTQFE